MVIEEKDFRLFPIKECGSRFDLELLYIINKGKENERSEFKNVAYGITLETALKYIITYRLNSKFTDSIDLKTYLQEYKSMLDELKKICELS